MKPLFQYLHDRVISLGHYWHTLVAVAAGLALQLQDSVPEIKATLSGHALLCFIVANAGVTYWLHTRAANKQ